MDMNNLTGSVVALVTPFKKDGSVDFERLEGLVDFHLANGTDGILVLGNGPDMRTVATVEHATVDAVTSLVSASIAPGEGSALVTYQPDEGTTPLQVSNRPVSDGRWALVRFFLGPDGATTAAGREAWAGSLTLANYTINALVFESSGRLVTLASERPVTDLTAWSATVVELSLADWEALRDEAGERFGS